MITSTQITINEINTNNVTTNPDRIQAITYAAGLDTNPSNLKIAKTPLDQRIKKSKFNQIISRMSDEDLQLTAYALCFNQDVATAIKCFHQSTSDFVQIAALIKQLEVRGIKIK